MSAAAPLALDPDLLRRDLKILDSLMLPSGLVIAAPTDAYRKVWVRDNCWVGLAYWYAGRKTEAIRLFNALLALLDHHSFKIDWILWEGKPESPGGDYKRLHPRYDTDGFEIPEPWGYAQNDSWGLLLICLATLESEGAGILTPRVKHLIQKLVWYLCAISYWEDPDSGMWEEGVELHASSIALCRRGIALHSDHAIVPERAIIGADAALAQLGNDESPTRGADLAGLTRIWPVGNRNPELMERVHELEGVRGVTRYLGDSYNCENPGDTAEWTLGIGWLGLCHLVHGNRTDAAHYYHWMQKQRRVWEFPESWILEGSNRPSYRPCEHTPLGWSHAMAVLLHVALEKHGGLR